MKKFVAFLAITSALFGQTKPTRVGIFDSSTVLTVYGRAFGRAPILGRLGTYKDIDGMAADTKDRAKQISAATNGKPVVIGIHLIYALAVPCLTSGPECLYYLGDDIVEKYIQPAAQRGWIVVLDAQLGRSDPVKQVRRMIDKGFLKYDNVHVALDPEYHSVDGHETPGIPVGTVTAAQINEVQQILDRYVESENLHTRKILIVHQFGDAAIHDRVPVMIAEKKTLRTFANVDLVIDADGLGEKAEKIRRYNLMTDPATYPFIRYRGIKIFYPNEWEKHQHFDKPPMDIEEIFGARPVPRAPKIQFTPNLITIA